MFRWKGENVSTTEVANIITALSFIIDANVYGVKVPGMFLSNLYSSQVDREGKEHKR